MTDLTRGTTQIRADLTREVVGVLRDHGYEPAAHLVEAEFGLLRECAHCGGPIPTSRRRQAKFCTPEHRVAYRIARQVWTPEKAEYQRQWRAKRKATASV